MQQRNILRLELLRKKQMLGDITKDELTTYSRIDPCIQRSFKSTFSVGLPVSGFSLILGAGLFAFGTVFNWSVTHRLCTHLLMQLASPSHHCCRTCTSPTTRSMSITLVSFSTGSWKSARLNASSRSTVVASTPTRSSICSGIPLRKPCSSTKILLIPTAKGSD